MGLTRFDTDPVERLDGFELQPIRWKYAFPVTGYEMAGNRVYQFAPDMWAEFEIPPGTRSIRMLVGIREGAYTGGNNTDGARMRWSLVVKNDSIQVDELYLNPRDNADQRGLLEYSFELPQTAGGTLRLEVDGGPRRHNAWDWLMIGSLKAE